MSQIKRLLPRLWITLVLAFSSPLPLALWARLRRPQVVLVAWSGSGQVEYSRLFRTQLASARLAARAEREYIPARTA